jgi:pimeloyl-ACP methyl ester carboxylesterase
MWREGFVPGGETRFWVRAVGHGDDVALLLHGFPQDGSTFEPLARLLADVGWRVVAPDLKGVGRSDHPHGGYDPSTLADEVSQLVRNLHVKRVLLVGHDWGGAVALATAFRHPGRVSGLVLLSAPYRQLDLRRAWHIALCNLPVVPELVVRAAPELVAGAALRHQSSVRESVDAERVAAAGAAIAADPAAWLGYYRTLSRRAVVDWGVRRVRQRLPMIADPRSPNALRVPVQVVWGRDDPVFPVSLGSRVAHDLDAPLEVLPGVGHHVHVEDPLAVARTISRFATAAGIAPAVPATGGARTDPAARPTASR